MAKTTRPEVVANKHLQVPQNMPITQSCTILLSGLKCAVIILEEYRKRYNFNKKMSV